MCVLVGIKGGRGVGGVGVGWEVVVVLKVKNTISSGDS